MKIDFWTTLFAPMRRTGQSSAQTRQVEVSIAIAAAHDAIHARRQSAAAAALYPKRNT